MERSNEECDPDTVDDLKDSKQEGVSADKAEKAETQKEKSATSALRLQALDNSNEIASNLALTAGTAVPVWPGTATWMATDRATVTRTATDALASSPGGWDVTRSREK